MNSAANPTPAPAVDRLAPYRAAGFESRRAYLLDLAEVYAVPVQTVFTLAQMLGPNEDFDALVTSLEDLDPDFG